MADVVFHIVVKDTILSMLHSSNVVLFTMLLCVHPFFVGNAKNKDCVRGVYSKFPTVVLVQTFLCADGYIEGEKVNETGNFNGIPSTN